MNGEDVTEFSHNQLVIIKKFPNCHFVSFPNITNINIMRFDNYKKHHIFCADIYTECAYYVGKMRNSSWLLKILIWKLMN